MPTNRRTVLKTDMEFYRTPEWGVQSLLDNEYFDKVDTIDEPCCGDGRIANFLRKKCYKVSAADIVDRGFGKVKDYLKDFKKKKNVITNPPYDKYIEPIIMHALEHTTNKVCMLVRLNFLEGQKRYHTLYNVCPPTRIWVFSERLSMYKGDVDKTDGGTTAYCWMVWDKTVEQNYSIVQWLQPGYKEGTVKRFKWGKKHVSFQSQSYRTKKAKKANIKF